LSVSPTYRRPARPLDRSKSGFLSSHSQRIEETALLPASVPCHAGKPNSDPFL
jgi:hypothetical protein